MLASTPSDLALSVSVTTRPRRPGEVDGRDYRFVDEARFDAMVADRAFYEWAEVFGHRYGTPIDEIEERLRAGTDVLLEIDVQGANQVRMRAPGAVLILLRPPSMTELERRLRSRGTESDERIGRRLAEAEAELGQATWFDHVVVNDRLERASAEVAAIIETSRARSAGEADTTTEDPS